MTDTDELAFAALFLKVRQTFNLRGDRAEVQQVCQVYFKVLRRSPLGLVQAGADAWIEKESRFPKPAEWLRAIPRRSAATLYVMAEDEATEHRLAARNGYEADPCLCHVCRQAGVSHRYLRYVPETDADDRDVRLLLDGKPVTRGHWAHGAELAAWYAARDRYLALKAKYPPKTMRTPSRHRHVPTPVATFVAEEILASIARNEALEQAVDAATPQAVEEAETVGAVDPHDG